MAGLLVAFDMVCSIISANRDVRTGRLPRIGAALARSAIGAAFKIGEERVAVEPDLLG
jgi:hypothetical protein